MRANKQVAEKGAAPLAPAIDAGGGSDPLRLAFAAIGAVLFLRYASEVFIPVVLAVFISYPLDPVVAALARLRVPRALGAALILLLLIGGLGAGVQTLADNVLDIVDTIPPAAQKLRSSLRAQRAQGGGAIEKVEKVASEIERSAAEAAQTTGMPGVTRVQVE